MKKDEFLWIKENRLYIKGLKKEYTIMHISDTHLNVWDEFSSEEEQNSAKSREEMWMRGKRYFAECFNEQFNKEQKISSVEAFEKLMAFAKDVKPDLLLLSGDNLDQMHPAGERYLKSKLNNYGGKVICVPGNHEAPAFDDFWSPGVKVVKFNEFAVVAVDNSRNTVSDNDLRTITALCNENLPLIILCHVPIVTSYCEKELKNLYPYYYIDADTADKNGKAFISLCEKSEAIKAVLCGHAHRYLRAEISEGKPEIICSSGLIGAVHLLNVVGKN